MKAANAVRVVHVRRGARADPHLVSSKASSATDGCFGLREAVPRAREATGSDNVRIHDLRHTGATILMTLGVPDPIVRKERESDSTYRSSRSSWVSPGSTRSPVSQPFASSKRTTGFGLLTSRKTAACTSMPIRTIEDRRRYRAASHRPGQTTPSSQVRTALRSCRGLATGSRFRRRRPTRMNRRCSRPGSHAGRVRCRAVCRCLRRSQTTGPAPSARFWLAMARDSRWPSGRRVVIIAILISSMSP